LESQNLIWDFKIHLTVEQLFRANVTKGLFYLDRVPNLKKDIVNLDCIFAARIINLSKPKNY